MNNYKMGELKNELHEPFFCFNGDNMNLPQWIGALWQLWEWEVQITKLEYKSAKHKPGI